jgi:hypothetical protein
MKKLIVGSSILALIITGFSVGNLAPGILVLVLPLVTLLYGLIANTAQTNPSSAV